MDESTPRVDDLDDLLPTRATLVQRLRDVEDQESWQRFFATYSKLIHNFAVKRGCTATEADEVVQETVIAVSRKMPDFHYQPEVCSFKGWLMHVANWRVIDQLRKRNHRIEAPPATEEGSRRTSFLNSLPDPAVPEVEGVWNEEWKQNAINIAMQRVKQRCHPEHYQIFHLAVIKKRSVSEIVRALGVNRGQVYLARHRIALLVKREIKQIENRTVK